MSGRLPRSPAEVKNIRPGNNGYGPLCGPITVRNSEGRRQCYPWKVRDNQETHGSNKDIIRSANDGVCDSDEKTTAEFFSAEDHIKAAFDAGRGDDYKYSELWGFVRRCRSHPDLMDRDGLTALEFVQDVLGVEFDDVEREEFVRAWDGIRVLLGHSLMSQALGDTEDIPLELPREHFVSGDYERFVTFAGWLQVARGNRAIILPVVKVAEILFRDGGQKMRVSRYRQWAVKHGYMKRSWVGSRVKHRADEYWFDVSQFPELFERAHPGIAASFTAAKHKERARFAKTTVHPDAGV
ncbi:MAG: hypothetical protein O7D91_10715 [Planctomycetota bacterium]|nr:hypothetical protein [Planctomycetota bacterium]